MFSGGIKRNQCREIDWDATKTSLWLGLIVNIKLGFIQKY